MTFLSPWLLAALVLLVPVLVAFLVRRRRSALRIPSTLLWKTAAVRRIRNKRIRYLTRMLAMAACLLAVAALVLGASQPREAEPGETVAVVIDVSASMGDGSSGTPLARAERHLSQMLWARRSVDTYVIIAAGERPVRLAGPTTEAAQLDGALEALRPESSAADLGSAIDLAAALVANRPSPRVVVLHDGGDLSGDLPDQIPQGVALQQRRFGWRDDDGAVVPDNLGIVTFAARRPSDIETEEERELLLAVATSSATERRARITIEAFGVDQGHQDIVIPPLGVAEVRLRVVTPAREIIARVEPLDGRDDELAADDQVTLRQGVVVPPRVVLVVPEGAPEAETFFAEQALRAAGVEEILRVTPREAGKMTRTNDVVVALSQPPEEQPPAPILFLATEGGGAGSVLPISGQRELIASDQAPAADGSVETPTRLRSVASNHALLRGVDLEGVTIERALAANVPEGAHALVELDGGAVVLTGGDSAEGWVYLGIDPVRSDLVLRVAFPVLIANSLALLGGATQVSVADSVPRSEVSLREGPDLGGDEAPEVAWSLPRTPTIWLALLGAILLGSEIFTWRKGWTR
jgi:hypothetical protein